MVPHLFLEINPTLFVNMSRKSKKSSQLFNEKPKRWMGKSMNPQYFSLTHSQTVVHLKDWIPAGVLPLVNYNETAGGKEQQEETNDTSDFHLWRVKFDPKGRLREFQRNSKRSLTQGTFPHLTSTWQPHSPPPSTNSPIFHWKFQNIFSPLQIHPLAQNFTFGSKSILICRRPEAARETAQKCREASTLEAGLCKMCKCCKY